MEYTITESEIALFSGYLEDSEKSAGTIENYLRHVRRFAAYVRDRETTREIMTRWKRALGEESYQSTTINAMITSVNCFLKWRGNPEACVKTLRVQKRMFREKSRELTREEYIRLIQAARERKKERLAMLIETICATGIRVSELSAITVEAVRAGQTEICLKGKIRRILLPGKLCSKLKKYARKEKIVSGEIFITRNEKSINRRQIWAELKWLCRQANVEETKVFPHNLRHLFAVTFYKANKDVVRLADVLGHSNVETTRIYLLTSGEEHMKQIERLNLVI